MQFKVERISGLNAICFCPYHSDTNTPNLSISLRDRYYGRWMCWACGKEGWLTEDEMKELDLSRNKKRKRPVSIDWHQLSADYFEACGTTELAVLSQLWNVDFMSLSSFFTGWDGEAYTFPMSDVNNGTIGIQRVWLDGTKKAVHGSKLGLFTSVDCTDYTVFITEGISDTVAVHDLGYSAIGKPCATYGDELIKEYILESDIHTAVIIPDNDEAGIKSAEELAKILPCIYHIHSFDEAKDIRDYIKLKGKEEVSKELEGYINGQCQRLEGNRETGS